MKAAKKHYSEISIYKVAQSEFSQPHKIGNIVNIDSEKFYKQKRSYLQWDSIQQLLIVSLKPHLLS